MQQLVSTAQPVNDFHEALDPRLLSHMNVIFVSSFTSSDLQDIALHHTMLHFQEESFVQSVSRLAPARYPFDFSAWSISI